MEKYTCKLCSRRFSNGRALGGHMRSHVVGGGGAPAAKTQLSSASSASTSVADDPEEDEEEDEGRYIHGGLGYVLRENPRKSFRLVDPQFSSSFASAAAAAAADAGSCSVVQDRESDNESPRAAAPAHHRRRSKRPRSRAPPPLHDVEPASSVSDATPEEDVALSLMMLSRDSWTNPKSKSETEQSFNHYCCYYYSSSYYSYKEEEEEEEEEEGGGGGGGGLRQSDGDDCGERARRGASRAVRSRAAPKSRSRYQCGTCKKTFRSYQALGGHRASHKKGGVAGGRGCCFPPPPPPEPNAGGARDAHACPFCSRVFASAQALGGHKRAHPAAAAAAAVPPPPPSAGSFGVIDLNLPAPADDDFELSAVSDADFGPFK
ncbi:zinc finger protein ZAT1-like [Ananas comosus]|uniref:Zinc finger protein ZAT1-like n=1 Tax=Ananas comosus TaxID=4615 RepID=A0A6P5ERL0_ANACO|nr:zinc finger protein ZAT1-like [Ananas comosus]